MQINTDGHITHMNTDSTSGLILLSLWFRSLKDTLALTTALQRRTWGF